MADRYATNAFTNFSQFEAGTFSQGMEQRVLSSDNPDFLYPPKTLRTAAVDANKGGVQKIQRGYMRMLSQGFNGGSALSKRRLHFQFNPDTIVRSVQARNDIQLWMNQDPVQLTQPIPGDANFAFELLFNREAEVVSGSYRDGSSIKKSQAKANLPLGDAGNYSLNSVTLPHSSVTDIGVLADLMVFDEIIGQGINTQLIEQVIKNAAGVNAKQRKDYARKADTSDTPTSIAQIKIKTDNDGKLKDGATDIIYSSKGSGYTSSPTVAIVAATGSGGKLTAVVEGGMVTRIIVDDKGSNYPKNATLPLTLTGGGGGGSKSADATSDEQDQPEVFDQTEARKALYNNFGNSAFLVSLPVRIVFSSLFMVEGYITSTQVTFNKFNANMVPTQCVVGVTMQAMYIGFARKETYLTKTLTDALKAANDALTADTTQSADQTALVSLGKNLLSKAVSPGVIYGNASVKQIFSDNTDYTQTLELECYASDALKAQLKKGSISEITQNGEWTITYLGNSSSPQGSYAVGDVIASMTASGKFNLSDLKDDHDTIKLQFSTTPLGPSQSIDKTSTSKYRIEVTYTFDIKASTGESVTASQRFSSSGEIAYTVNDYYYANYGSLVQVYDPNQSNRDPSKRTYK